VNLKSQNKISFKDALNIVPRATLGTPCRVNMSALAAKLSSFRQISEYKIVPFYNKHQMTP
jgi:hypothetical protein